MKASHVHFATEEIPLEKGMMVRLKGELDAHSAVMASNVLESALDEDVEYMLVDCSQLVYISSAGVGVIISAYHISLSRQICLTLFGMQPKIKNVFEVLGMDKILNLALSKEEALSLTFSVNGKE